MSIDIYKSNIQKTVSYHLRNSELVKRQSTSCFVFEAPINARLLKIIVKGVEFLTNDLINGSCLL